MGGVKPKLLPSEEMILQYFEKIVATHIGFSIFPHPQAWANYKKSRMKQQTVAHSQNQEGCSAQGMHQ